MSRPTAVLVQFDAGNVTSVAHAVRHVGGEPRLAESPDEIASAERVIFPGVGAAGATMESLSASGVADAIRTFVATGRPFFGICIGCQVIFERSDEDGGVDCLGLLRGTVRKFQFAPGDEQKIPHMGWNELRLTQDAYAHSLFASIPPGSQFYYVHSYYPEPADERIVRGRSTYGEVDFATAFLERNVAAVQFHTEKSGRPGLQLLRNFLSWSP